MHRLYPLAGRLAYRLSYPLLRFHSQPRTRVLITDGRGHVLLMRGWFGRQRWDLPGGGIKRNEEPAQAAVREVLEETGVRLSPEDISLIGSYNKTTSDLTHGVILFHATIPRGDVAPLGRFKFEVLEVAWWPLNRLPASVNGFVVKALRKLEEIET